MGNEGPSDLADAVPGAVHPLVSVTTARDDDVPTTSQVLDDFFSQVAGVTGSHWPEIAKVGTLERTGSSAAFGTAVTGHSRHAAFWSRTRKSPRKVPAAAFSASFSSKNGRSSAQVIDRKAPSASCRPRPPQNCASSVTLQVVAFGGAPQEQGNLRRRRGQVQRVAQDLRQALRGQTNRLARAGLRIRSDHFDGSLGEAREHRPQITAGVGKPAVAFGIGGTGPEDAVERVLGAAREGRGGARVGRDDALEIAVRTASG